MPTPNFWTSGAGMWPKAASRDPPCPATDCGDKISHVTDIVIETCGRDRQTDKGTGQRAEKYPPTDGHLEPSVGRSWGSQISMWGKRNLDPDLTPYTQRNLGAHRLGVKAKATGLS